MFKLLRLSSCLRRVCESSLFSLLLVGQVPLLSLLDGDLPHLLLVSCEVGAAEVFDGIPGHSLLLEYGEQLS
jgi:hypothetical protein